MIIKTKAKQAVEVEIDSQEIVSTIVDKIILERLKECDIQPDSRYKLGSLIRIDSKTSVGYIVTSVSDDDRLDNVSAELPLDVVKIWKAYITLNHAIYSSEYGK
jgi:hypothetical protein